MRTSTLALVDNSSPFVPAAQLEAELVKDVWDARNIPGLRYPPHTGNYFVHFAQIPAVFRSLVKDYMRFELAAGRAAGTLNTYTHALGKFLIFFSERYPNVDTLHDLEEPDIDAFLLHLHATPNSHGTKRSDQEIWRCIDSLERFLSYLERIDSVLKPSRPTARIIWPYHYPPLTRNHGSQEIKYIPQAVLAQLDAVIQYLAPSCIPIVILLRASGWRISDVLYLKLDTCLHQEGANYWLVGDIQKTRVLGHKVPITQEIAAAIKTQITWIKKYYSPEDNPNGWLFPASKKYGRANSQRFKHGDPLGSVGVRESLNHLAVKYKIIDEHGQPFHFKLHAFRHTKAVELLNQGMSLFLVQQWMAHASPEMTLIYAKILDDTMRTAWEKTVRQGIVQFADGKPEYVPGKKLLFVRGDNGFDPERVREHRQNVKMAIGNCLKTAKIVCKFVELPCFHCPAYVLTPEDLPALEAYEQQILERIEIGKQAGNMHWIEVNQNNLDQRVRPAIALLREGHIIAQADRQEREYSDDEWEQRQVDKRDEAHE